jgi:transposase
LKHTDEQYERRIAELEAIVKKQALLIEELRAEIHRLRIGSNSRNSSLPPGKDLKRPKRLSSTREKSNRKRGGQPGHEGKYLEMRQDIDAVEDHSTVVCTQCGTDLSLVEGSIDQRGQILDIPIVKIEVTEHRQIVKVCPCCQAANKGKLPGTLDYCQVQYGEQIRNLIVYLNIYQFVPVQRIQELLNEIYGCQVSTGFIKTCIEQKAEVLRSEYAKIKEAILQSPCVGSDETGCKIEGIRQWMWIWCTGRFSYITPSMNRGYKTIQDVLGEVEHHFTLVSDCWASQLKTMCKKFQLCLAHLIRDCNKLIDYYNSRWAINLKTLFQEIVIMSKEDHPPSKKLKIIEARLDRLLGAILSQSSPPIKTFQKRLIKYRKYITTCLYDPVVPATNNQSERGIRNLKVKENVSKCFRSTKGAESYAIIRSIFNSAILQGKRPMDALRSPDILFS